jgi:pimeloyl-ACP methyl ester carboxylesterase
LIPNPSFEKGKDFPENWEVRSHDQDLSPESTFWDSELAHTGKKSMRWDISSIWYVRIDRQYSCGSVPTEIESVKISIDPTKTYEFSVWSTTFKQDVPSKAWPRLNLILRTFNDDDLLREQGVGIRPFDRDLGQSQWISRSITFGVNGEMDFPKHTKRVQIRLWPTAIFSEYDNDRITCENHRFSVWLDDISFREIPLPPEDRKIIFIGGLDSECLNDCSDPAKVGFPDKQGQNRVQWIVNHLTTNDEVKKQVLLDPNRDFLYMSYSGEYCEKDGSPDFRRPKYAAQDTCGGVIDAADKLNKMVGSLNPNIKLDLIGHSMGGLVAAAWLWAHPTMQPRVNSVVTFDSPLRGVPDKIPFGVSACDTSSSLSWNDLWCQNYADANRRKCASVIVSSIANLGKAVPFFTMDATHRAEKVIVPIEAVPGDRTTLLSSNSRLYCQFDDDHGSIWDREGTNGGAVNCWGSFSYPLENLLTNYPPVPGPINIEKPSLKVKAAFVACGIMQLGSGDCENKLRK